jgi:hypothetical protein
MIEINKIYNEDCLTGMQRIDKILKTPKQLFLMEEMKRVI